MENGNFWLKSKSIIGKIAFNARVIWSIYFINKIAQEEKALRKLKALRIKPEAENKIKRIVM